MEGKIKLIMSSRALNYLLLTIIVGLIAALIIINNDESHRAKLRSENFLVNFDNGDFKRLKEMVERFKEGKGDNLMLIPPIIDGGYWIHDVMSNGREIHWTVDNTRDGMSSNTGKTNFICKAIDIRETFELSKCKNFKEDEKLEVVSFFKDEL